MAKTLVLMAVAALSGCEVIQKAQDEAAQDQIARIHTQVAEDAVKQYEIAKRGTDAIQTCVQAGLVSAAFLQAKDEPSYTKWKAIETTDCAAAGMPK